jgi:methylated-DNA-[protein]-cysteine S-methyltransferase
MHRGAFESPIGTLVVTADESGAVTHLRFSEETAAGAGDPSPVCRPALDQLAAYFDGFLEVFDLELAPGGTEFEDRVWAMVREIPFGSTDTYGAIAHRLGDPQAVRAVGVANARNPIAIVVPCHRVIGADGALTGYAGGLWRKRWLLDHEAGQERLRF